MKIRVQGLDEEVREAINLMQPVFDVISVSGNYQNRGDSREVRVYLEVRMPQGEKEPGT